MEEIRANELRELFLFQLVTMEELKEVVAICREKMYAAGMKIFAEKDKGETICIIKTGSVKITKNEGGKEKELITLSQGDFFGEVALFDYVFRTASAITLEDTTIMEINRAEFNKFFSQKPQIAAKILYQMMTEMSRRLRKKDTPLGGFLF